MVKEHWPLITLIGACFIPITIMLVLIGCGMYFSRNDILPGCTVTLNGVGEVIEHGPKEVSKGEVLLVEGGSVFVKVERSDILKFKLEDVTRE